MRTRLGHCSAALLSVASCSIAFAFAEAAQTLPFPSESLTLPYVRFEFSDSEASQWDLDGHWEIVKTQGSSQLVYAKNGRGLGSKRHELATLENWVHVPDINDPFLYISQHLELPNKSGCVRINLKTPQAAWKTAKQICASESQVRRVGIDLKPFAGKALKLQFQAYQPERGTEEAASKSTKVDKPKNTHDNVGGRKAAKDVLWAIEHVEITKLDSDGDGIPDELEHRVGTNPTDADSKATDRDNNHIPDLIDDLNGVWYGPCRDLGGDEFMRAVVSISPLHLAWRFESSGESDCSVPWLTVQDLYEYRFSRPEVLSTQPSPLATRLVSSIVFANTPGPEEEISRLCKREVRPETAYDMTGIACDGNIKYPAEGTEHTRPVSKPTTDSLQFEAVSSGSPTYDHPLLDESPVLFKRQKK